MEATSGQRSFTTSPLGRSRGPVARQSASMDERAILGSNQWLRLRRTGKGRPWHLRSSNLSIKQALGMTSIDRLDAVDAPGRQIAGARSGEMRLVNPLAEPLLSVRDVARALRVAPYTVYVLCDLGELPHVRVSSAIRVRPLDLQAFLRNRE
jgi:Helix-turn-helix domain